MSTCEAPPTHSPLRPLFAAGHVAEARSAGRVSAALTPSIWNPWTVRSLIITRST